MKLSTIWEDFDEFSKLCLTIGTIDTKYKMKIQLTFFDDKNQFDSNWKNLFNIIIDIFIKDKRVASKFDYRKDTIEITREKLKINNPDSRELRKGLFEKISLNIRNNQKWGSSNSSYEVTDYINLISTNKIAEIKTSTLETDNFFITVDTNKILIKYIDKIYNSSINLLTGKKVQISKYPEILHFINSKYFNISLEKLSYNQFEYLVRSFTGINNLRVPSENNGYLSSSLTSRSLKNLTETDDYFSKASKRFENIKFIYCMEKYNYFSIMSKLDIDISKSIENTQNEYGDMKNKFPFSPKSTERTFKK